VKSKLADEIVTDTVQLIEPLDEDDQPGATKPGQKPNKNKKNRSKAGKTDKTTASKADKPTTNKDKPKSEKQDDEHDKGLLVQMSYEWIRKNLLAAVGQSVMDDIKLKGYSRHLFFSPYYHKSGSPAAHQIAKKTGQPPSEHKEHDAFHYGENGAQGVKAAVNKRKLKLQKEFGKNHPNLQVEK
jgi:hypothetical protein